jgi:N-acetyl-gamma-glutamyl-phosphate reductase
MGIRVAVAGASGYAGGELLRLLAAHPDLEVTLATAHSQAGLAVSAVHPKLATELLFEPTDPAALAEHDLVFLALPRGESAAVAAALPPSTRVVDLSPDHRNLWVYGLPEVSRTRAAVAAATRVANPGCYATAVILALAPLISAGVADPEDVVVVAASGTTGAGRVLAPHLLASEVIGALTPYRVGHHQHVPEIKRATGATSISFTPILAPMPRGILATVTTRAVTGADPAAVLRDAYAAEAFVRVLPGGRWPTTAATAGSNACHLQAVVDADSGRVIVVAALDNLGKGAAGQAVQNANLMLGRPETAGLAVNGV